MVVRPPANSLYIEDAAEGLLLTAEHYDSSELVSLVSVNLTETIARLIGFTGQIIWGTSRSCRMLDTTRTKVRFGFEARTSFEAGLRKTTDCMNRRSVRREAF